MVTIRSIVVLLVACLCLAAQALDCPQCGAPLPEGAAFCPECGDPVDVEAQLRARGALVAVGSATERINRLPNKSPGLTGIELPKLRGSGFVIDDEGHLLTAYSVVEGATELWVRDAAGVEHAAALVGVDPATGLALLRMENPPPPLELADNAPAERGTPLTALGLSPQGVLLATPAVQSADGRLRSGFLDLERSLLFDADLKPSHHGGPLLDADGRVAGLVVIRRGALQERGRGLAIPVELLSEVAAVLRDEGEYRRPWLGLTCLADEGGCRVAFTLPDSPAAVELAPGELLSALDGEPLTTPTAFQRRILELDIGATVELTVAGDDGTRGVVLTTAERPAVIRPAPLDTLNFQLGLVARLEPAGLVPLALRPASPAATEGLPLDRGPLYRALPGAAFESENYRRLDSPESLAKIVADSYLERHFALGLFWGPTERDGVFLISPLRVPLVI